MSDFCSPLNFSSTIPSSLRLFLEEGSGLNLRSTTNGDYIGTTDIFPSMFTSGCAMGHIGSALAVCISLLSFPVLAEYRQSPVIKSFRIGFISDQAPFSSKIAGKDPQGYAVDLCIRIAAEVSGVEKPHTEYVETTLTEAFDAVAERRIDLLCGAITINLERRRLVDFSQPIFRTGAGALLRVDSPRELRELFSDELSISPPRSPQMRAFASIAIGARLSSTTEGVLRQAIRKGGYKASVANFATHAEGVAALEARQIDAYFADGALLGNLLKNAGNPTGLIIGDKLLTNESYGIAIRRDDADLRLRVDRALSRLYRTNEFATVVRTYFGDEASAIRSQIILQSIPD